MISTIYDNDVLEDLGCDPRLLPSYLRARDNSARLTQLKKAVQKAKNICLNEEQQLQIQLYYGRQLSKREIARQQGKSWAAVSRSMTEAEQAVKNYVELYMEIYDDLQRQNQRELEENW